MDVFSFIQCLFLSPCKNLLGQILQDLNHFAATKANRCNLDARKVCNVNTNGFGEVCMSSSLSRF